MRFQTILAASLVAVVAVTSTVAAQAKSAEVSFKAASRSSDRCHDGESKCSSDGDAVLECHHGHWRRKSCSYGGECRSYGHSAKCHNDDDDDECVDGQSRCTVGGTGYETCIDGQYFAATCPGGGTCSLVGGVATCGPPTPAEGDPCDDAFVEVCVAGGIAVCVGGLVDIIACDVGETCQTDPLLGVAICLGPILGGTCGADFVSVCTDGGVAVCVAGIITLDLCDAGETCQTDPLLGVSLCLGPLLGGTCGIDFVSICTDAGLVSCTGGLITLIECQGTCGLNLLGINVCLPILAGDTCDATFLATCVDGGLALCVAGLITIQVCPNGCGPGPILGIDACLLNIVPLPIATPIAQPLPALPALPAVPVESPIATPALPLGSPAVGTACTTDGQTTCSADLSAVNVCTDNTVALQSTCSTGSTCQVVGGEASCTTAPANPEGLACSVEGALLCATDGTALYTCTDGAFTFTQTCLVNACAIALGIAACL